MNIREKFYKSISDENGICWPESSDDKQSQAEELFGATVMGVMDTIIQNRLSDNEEHNKIIKEAAASTLYWLFVKLDQFPGGFLKIVLEEFENEQGESKYLGQPNDEELRLKFFDWLESYSELVDENDI